MAPSDPLEPLDSQLFESLSHPLSLGSEPPDVKNWFSSYQYESPSQESFIPHIDSDSCSCEDGVRAEDFEALENLPVDGTCETSRLEEAKVVGAAKGICQVNELLTVEPILISIAVFNHGNSKEICQIKSFSRSNPTIRICGTGKERLPEAKHYSLQNTSFKKPRLLEPEADDLRFRSDCRQGNTEAQIPPFTKHYRENRGGNDSGWISTRRLKDQKRTEKPREVETTLKLEDSNLHMQQLKTTGERNVPTDITNLIEAEIEVEKQMEIVGKWRCPGKRKRALGPPLKQLGLERWVRRVI